MLIEQAIFASTITDRAQGYQLVARSPGVSEADARELSAWGPSHDSLLESSGVPHSINFFPLASGLYCVSRTTQAGAEFSGRGGAGVYTQFLLVPAEVLARFANNPFAVVRAAMAKGVLRVDDPIPETLEPVQLAGRAGVVDMPLLAKLSRAPGPAALATLIQSALSSDRLAIAAEVPIDQLLAGLISVLPVECRTEISFATGLRFSPRRAVRILALSQDPACWRVVARQGLTLLSLDAVDQTEELHWEGWAGHVARLMASSQLSVLAAQLNESRPSLTSANLDSLADHLDGPGGEHNAHPVRADAQDEMPAMPQLQAAGVDSDATTTHHSHGAHLPPGRDAITEESRSRTAEMVTRLAADSPQTLELLERIDDLVFAAIAGDASALSELEVLWPTVHQDLDPDTVEQSREQYLRCALSIWGQSAANDLNRPERAAAAIDVLCVLFER